MVLDEHPGVKMHLTLPILVVLRYRLERFEADATGWSRVDLARIWFLMSAGIHRPGLGLGAKLVLGQLPYVVCDRLFLKQGS
jgi:hypothetical protein